MKLPFFINHHFITIGKLSQLANLNGTNKKALMQHYVSNNLTKGEKLLCSVFKQQV